jgi:hypothetical protein
VTRINDYIWQMPHTPESDDPADVAALQQMFNRPIRQKLESAFEQQGYTLSVSDIHIPPDKVVTLADMANTYKANVRFVKYLEETIIVRVHFEHDEWALDLPTSDEHRFVVNLDRFKVRDRATMIAEPAWEGRLTSRISRGEESLWTYETVGEFTQQLGRIWEKFEGGAQAWLEDRSTL